MTGSYYRKISQRFQRDSLLGYLNILIYEVVTFIKCGKAKSFKFSHQSRIMTFIKNNLEFYLNYL